MKYPNVDDITTKDKFSLYNFDKREIYNPDKYSLRKLLYEVLTLMVITKPKGD